MDEIPDLTQLVAAWHLQDEAHQQAHLVDRWARYVPETGWRAILTILQHPEGRSHVDHLANVLQRLISSHGEDFIDRIEVEAATNPIFRELLSKVNSDPSWPIPEPLWDRLSNAAGVPVGPTLPHMDRLYDEIPDLAQVETFDPEPPLDPTLVPEVASETLEATAGAWIRYENTFWAWEEVQRIVLVENSGVAWNLLTALITSASQDALGSIGAGPLEDLLCRDGAALLPIVEQEAERSQRFRNCLSHVWPRDMPAEVWARIVLARGDEPQRG